MLLKETLKFAFPSPSPKIVPCKIYQPPQTYTNIYIQAKTKRKRMKWGDVTNRVEMTNIYIYKTVEIYICMYVYNERRKNHLKLVNPQELGRVWFLGTRTPLRFLSFCIILRGKMFCGGAGGKNCTEVETLQERIVNRPTSILMCFIPTPSTVVCACVRVCASLQCWQKLQTICISLLFKTERTAVEGLLERELLKTVGTSVAFCKPAARQNTPFIGMCGVRSCQPQLYKFGGTHLTHTSVLRGIEFFSFTHVPGTSPPPLHRSGFAQYSNPPKQPAQKGVRWFFPR